MLVVDEEDLMRGRSLARLAVAAVLAATTLAIGGSPASAAPAGRVNDPACAPGEAHPNPVVLLHGLGATHYEDLNVLQGWLAGRGYCTFAETYGAYPGFPLVGGLRPVADSAPDIADYIRQVQEWTGAGHVDVVGHSEGGFQSLYVTKTQGVADLVGAVVAIAPPSHGTSFGGLYTLARTLGADDGADTALETFGCGACTDLTTGGPAVRTLEDGPIAQPGVDYTVITSRNDRLVTPTETSFVREPGVVNQYVQDFCPFDPVGHIGEAYDTNVWNMVANGLEGTPDRRFPCSAGLPG